MAKPWAEVAASPQYQALSPEQQEQARSQYFEQVVLPRVPAGREQDARAQFWNAATGAGSVSAPPKQNSEPAPASQRFIAGLRGQVAGLNQFVQHALPDVGGSREVADRMAAGALRNSEDMTATLKGGIDWARLGGEATVPALLGAVALPLIPASPGGAAMLGAGQGAIAGTAAPVDVSRGGYAGQKAGQVLAGGGAGTVFGPAGFALGKGASALFGNIAQRVRALSQQAGRAPSAAQVDAEIETVLRSQGVDWASMANQVKDRIRQQVQAAGVSPAALDPVQLARRADAERLGVQLTPGDELRSTGPEGVRRWSMERNLAKMQGGEPIARQIDTNNRLILAGLDQQRAGIPVARMTPMEADDSVVAAIRAAADPVNTLVNDLYQVAYGSQAANIPLRGNRLMDLTRRETHGAGGLINVEKGLRRQLEDLDAGRNPAVQRRLAQTTPFTVGDAEALAQYGNAQWADLPDIQRSATAAAVRAVQRAADEAAGGTSPFWQGRTMEAARQQFLDEVPAYRQALNLDAVPDGFIQKNVLSQNVKPTQLVNLMRALDADAPEAAAAIRARVLDQIRDAAGAGAGGVEGVSQAQLNKALDAIGDDKLRALFPPEQVENLRAAGRVSEVINMQPPGHSVNNSNTAIVGGQGLIGLMSGNPLWGLVRRYVQPSFTESRATAALRQVPLAPPKNQLLTVRPPSYISRLPGPLAAAPAEAWAIEEASR